MSQTYVFKDVLSKPSFRNDSMNKKTSSGKILHASSINRFSLFSHLQNNCGNNVLLTCLSHEQMLSTND